MGREAMVVSQFFFCGTLRHLPLLHIVLGREVSFSAAWLHDRQMIWGHQDSYPLMQAAAGGKVEGIVVPDLTADDVARLVFFEGGFGFEIAAMRVETDHGAVDAQIFQPALGDPVGAIVPWSLTEWQARFGAEFEAMAQDYMALYGVKPGYAVAARFPQMLARGASRVRARNPAPTAMRKRVVAGDVAIAALREPYARFFAIEEIDVSFRRFDGSMSPKVTRAGFIACDAVTVLPYDPLQDRVLVVDQFRAGPHLRGDPQPWQIEAIAGRIDAGETPEHAARREAEEEAGLQLGALLPVANYYPSPGCSAEYLYSFVAITDLPDGAAGVFGVEGEAEDIRGHLLSFDQLMALVASGEISNAPTVLTAFWLAGQRDRLRKDHQNGTHQRPA
jgi:nudix-type nucleoside diphosphatase (YffH/AdpP family)